MDAPQPSTAILLETLMDELIRQHAQLSAPNARGLAVSVPPYETHRANFGISRRTSGFVNPKEVFTVTSNIKYWLSCSIYSPDRIVGYYTVPVRVLNTDMPAWHRQCEACVCDDVQQSKLTDAEYKYEFPRFAQLPDLPHNAALASVLRQPDISVAFALGLSALTCAWRAAGVPITPELAATSPLVLRRAGNNVRYDLITERMYDRLLATLRMMPDDLPLRADGCLLSVGATLSTTPQFRDMSLPDRYAALLHAINCPTSMPYIDYDSNPIALIQALGTSWLGYTASYIESMHALAKRNALPTCCGLIGGALSIVTPWSSESCLTCRGASAYGTAHSQHVTAEAVDPIIALERQALRAVCANMLDTYRQPLELNIGEVCECNSELSESESRPVHAVSLITVCLNREGLMDGSSCASLVQRTRSDAPPVAGHSVLFFSS